MSDVRAESRSDNWELIVTPGHRVFQPNGTFARVDEVLARGGEIVLEGAVRQRIFAERIVYSQLTCDLFEKAEEAAHTTNGGLALAPHVEVGWRTYNFEVETYHTYIANGVMVHNDSLADFTGFLAQIGVQDGLLTSSALASITAQFGSSMASLAGWGGVDGIASTRDAIQNYMKLAEQARASGDEQLAQASEGAALSLADNVAIAKQSLDGAIADTAVAHPEISRILQAQRAQLGETGPANSTVTGADGIQRSFDSTGYLASEKSSNGDGTYTVVSYGLQGSVSVIQNAQIVGSSGAVQSATNYSYDANRHLASEVTTDGSGNREVAAYGFNAGAGESVLQSVTRTDSGGHVVSVDAYAPDASHVLTTYDSSSRVASETFTDTNGVSSTTTYTRNLDGSIVVNDSDHQNRLVATDVYASQAALDADTPLAQGVTASGTSWSDRIAQTFTSRERSWQPVPHLHQAQRRLRHRMRPMGRRCPWTATGLVWMAEVNAFSPECAYLPRSKPGSAA